MADHRPFGAPLKPPVCREKAAGVSDSRPLGAAMDSPSFHGRHKYCHNGAWPSPTITAPARLGSKMAGHRPLGGPSKRPICRKKLWGP
jgi:hypothetical protein